MADLPTGTVTLLFTDIEGSTQLLQRLGPRYEEVLTTYRSLLRSIFARHEGQEVDTQGDSFFVAFPRARDAVLAAIEVQHALAVQGWPEGISLATRMGLHTGEPRRAREGYVGLDVHRAARIGAAGHGGQVLLSATTRELVAHELPEGVALRDLGEHRLKDLRYPSRIFQLVIPELQVNFPPLKTLDAHPTNLPMQLTSFIGRAQEIEAVRQRLLDPQVRLLTLIGPGGTGKTRLALQVAAELLPEFPDGVWFVDLAPVRDPSLVTTTIVKVLGVTDVGGQSLNDRLGAFLRDKRLLLVLDNFEQVVSVSPLVADLLKAAPQVSALVTSRIVLRLYGEQEYPVLPLALPKLKHGQAPDAFQTNAAVVLFEQRARAVKPDFELTYENAGSVAEICTRLDGLPLAIELAAARLKLFSPQALLTRLNQRFKTLTGGPRDLPARQQTLRAAIEWSYDLLAPAEQTFFRRLGVFVGGWTVEAAEAICSGVDDTVVDVIEGLAVLLDQSLVQQQDGVAGEPRFTMLETIREYALERLNASGELEVLRQHHARYYLTLAESVALALEEGSQGGLLDQLELEHANLRAALRWALDTDPEVALRLASALGIFWIAQGYLHEGQTSLELALARNNSGSLGLRARALWLNGWLAWLPGEWEQAQTLYAASLALAQETDNKSMMARALAGIGALALAGKDPAAAIPAFEEGLRHARDCGDRWAILLLLWQLATALVGQNDAFRAIDLYNECVALARDSGEQLHRAQALYYLGGLALLRGDIIAARSYLEEGRTWAQHWSLLGVSHVPEMLGRVLVAQRDIAAARELLIQSLRGYQEAGSIPCIMHALEGFARLALGQGQPERAVRLLSAAASWGKTHQSTLMPIEQALVDQTMAAAHSLVTEAAFAAEWAEGRAMALDQAVAYALSKEAAPGA